MIYFLAILLALSVAFIAVLSRYGLPPKTALYKILARTGYAPERWRPVSHDAPYRRTVRASAGLHRPALLNLDTSDGSGQACHPDVVHIPTGFGSRGWPYWMVCTPYPYQEERFENPEIFSSFDGVAWTIPDGGQNPLVPTPEHDAGHHSDPDMIFHENQLWLFYRKTLRRGGTRGNKLYLIRSTDGVRWSLPMEILSEHSGTELLSPAVIHDGACFVMWTVEKNSAEFRIMRRTSSDAIDWSAPVPAKIVGMADGLHPWHLDIIREEDRLSAMLVSCIGASGAGSRIHYAYSEDHGRTWFDTGFLLEQAYEFEANLQYRATLCKMPNHPAHYELWYSASNFENMFSIAYLRMVREEGKLFPYEPQSAAEEDFQYQHGR